MPDDPPRWEPYPVPQKFGGGFCVVLGQPDEKLMIGRQIGAVPAGSMTYPEAQAIAKTLNRLLEKDRARQAAAEQQEATAHANG